MRTNPTVFVLGGTEGKKEAGVGSALGEKRRQLEEVVVFPLLSWYHASWDDEPDLPPGTHVQQSGVLQTGEQYGSACVLSWLSILQPPDSKRINHVISLFLFDKTVNYYSCSFFKYYTSICLQT